MNISRQLEADRVRVALEWTHKNGVTYAVSVDPEVNVSYTWKNSAQLSVSYNTKYNISVVASLCGKNRTVFTTINYGKLSNDHFFNFIKLSLNACSKVPSSNF